MSANDNKKWEFDLLLLIIYRHDIHSYPYAKRFEDSLVCEFVDEIKKFHTYWWLNLTTKIKWIITCCWYMYNKQIKDFYLLLDMHIVVVVARNENKRKLNY